MQLASEGSYNRPGNKQTETGGRGTGMQWLEQPFRCCNARAVVGETNKHRLGQVIRADTELPLWPPFQRSATVLSQIDEYLQQTGMVRPYMRQGRGDSKSQPRSGFIESRRDDGAQLL